MTVADNPITQKVWLVEKNVLTLLIFYYIMRLRGASARAAAYRFDPYVAGTNPAVERGDLSFGWDLINRRPTSHQVWHIKEPSLLKAVSDKQ
jgi:hypothetical protein